jgi:hypothetical protein
MDSKQVGQDRRDGWARLAHEVRARRQWLQLSHSGLSKRGGPSHETVRLVEAQGRPSFRDLTLSQLDRALQWKPGIARRIVDGTAPADHREWEAELSVDELEQRAQSLRALKRGPEGMRTLPMSLDDVPDIELAGELVSRLTRGGSRAENVRLLGELMGLLTRLSDTGDDEHRHAV